MGSILSRRLTQPEEPNKKPPIEPIKPMNAAPTSAAPIAATPAPAPAKEEANGKDHNVPPKRRTTPRVAEMRRQIRGKLLASPDEADEWQRDNPEHQKIILDRLKIYLQRAGIQVNKAEFEELSICLLDDLLGFG